MAPAEDGIDSLMGRDLLDLIDRLRKVGLGDRIPLPQIIVVGDQSSGKSSVLEAISRLSFPRGDGVCTTFATELILRNDPVESIHASIEVHVEKDDKRTDEQKAKLTAWRGSLTGLEGFEDLVKEAKSLIIENSGRGQFSYSYDKLRIRATGPQYPSLTLVDLPGVIKSPNKGQTLQDVTDVEKIVRSYMENKNAIILAVVSAETEPANQSVFTLVQRIYDPEGLRTIGVITKPDRAEENSNKQAEMISCAENEFFKLNHGWHVLKNRGFDSTCSWEDRAAEEKKFFETPGRWSRLKKAGTGAAKLQTKLSSVLEKEIRKVLPDIVDIVEKDLDNMESQLHGLGDSRTTPKDMQTFLQPLATRFQKIVEQSLIGSYNDDFFNKIEGSKLRATIQKMNEAFVIDMQENGRKRIIVNESSDIEKMKQQRTRGQEVVDRQSFIRMIEKRSLEDRGIELPGMVNRSRLVSGLFKEQSEKWERIARKHLQRVYEEVRGHLGSAASYVAPQEEVAGNLRAYLKPKLEAKYEAMKAKLVEIVTPFQSWHPIMLQQSYLYEVYGKTADRLRTIPTSIDFFSGQALQQYELTLDEMEAYYNVAMNTFIQNIAVLATEMILIKNLEEVFTPLVVYQMSEEELMYLASESDDAHEHRVTLSGDIGKLRAAKGLCDEYIYRARFSRSPNRRVVTPDLVLNAPSPPSTEPGTPVQYPVRGVRSKGCPMSKECLREASNAEKLTSKVADSWVAA